MPYLTLPITREGAVVEVLVSITSQRQEALSKDGKTIPSPIQVPALIDTGADASCVDSSIVASLQLNPTGCVNIHTPSTQGIPHASFQYDVKLILAHKDLSFVFQPTPILEARFDQQRAKVILGRDVLSCCLFVYDGRSEVFHFAF